MATPCPLLLAAPIAIVSGISRAAKRGIIVKGGGALEALARARVMLFDKTGTLTAGRPHLAQVVTAPERTPDEVLALAASLEQVSPARPGGLHRGRRARAGRGAASARGRRGGARRGHLGHGRRASAVLAGTAEFAGGGAPLPLWARDVRRRASLEGATSVYVAADGVLVGALVLDDPIRPETPRVIRSLRRVGVRRLVMVTGDHYGVADLVAAAIGVDGVLAERTPADKVDAVIGEKREADGVLVMVGDGINDAPALASADVGVAMGARGATASSEAADVVITVDRLDRLPEAIRIAGRARRIALESVLVGMGLSMAAMLVAAAGFLQPVAGALVQEAIDVIVILNALRALTGGIERTPRIPGWGDLSARLQAEHRDLDPAIAGLRSLADALGSLPAQEAKARLDTVRTFLVDVLVPHEEHEDREVFPMLARAAGSDDLTSALHRTHTEIFHLIRLADRLVQDIPEEGPAPEDLNDLRRVLYGLDAILRLHMAQEEELYLALGDEHPTAREPATASA